MGLGELRRPESMCVLIHVSCPFPNDALEGAAGAGSIAPGGARPGPGRPKTLFRRANRWWATMLVAELKRSQYARRQHREGMLKLG
jgi:hypothetical protein